MTPRGRPGRLRLDAARCDGFGMCVLVFPDRLALDEWGYPVVDDEPVAPGREMRAARRAVRCCPRQALAIEPAP